MKTIYNKLFVALPLAFLLGCSADKSVEEAFSATSVEDAKGEGLERCASMKVHLEKLKENPGLARKMEAIEAHTRQFEQSLKATSKPTKPGNGGGSGGGGTTETTIQIPVVINVIYSNDKENISDAQIQSQIDILNADFNAKNSDLTKTSAFSTLKSSLNITFTKGQVIRKYSNKTSWGTRDAMKSSKTGGIDPTNPAYNLNIWVCNIGGGILGYAQFPGGSLSTDGVVVGPQYFGDRGYVEAPYDKGRTATHEVGHWINLRHIWGDATCGTDYVADTPTHNTANYGCPESDHRSTCDNSVEMTMNYMDYTYDACMYMFSTGQKTRGRSVFAVGGPRSSFVTVQ